MVQHQNRSPSEKFATWLVIMFGLAAASFACSALTVWLTVAASMHPRWLAYLIAGVFWLLGAGILYGAYWRTREWLKALG